MDPWSHLQRTMSTPWSQNDAIDDDVDVCRVCRSGAPEDGPLFWPCQCSGSMKYVHESCLNDWINARGTTEKPKCELCGHELTYEKIFAADMPSRLPPRLFAHHLSVSVSNWVLYALRAALVITSWLVLLPHCIVWIFRFLLWAADSVGVVTLFVSGRAPAHLSQPGKTRRVSNAISVVNRAINERPIDQLRDGLLSNVTAIAAKWTNPERLHLLARTTEAISRAEAATSLSTATCPNTVGNLTALSVTRRDDTIAINGWHTFVNSFASDTFTGQIITSVVVIVFVIGFFMREWIVFNVPVDEPQPQVNAPVRDGQIAAMPQNEVNALIDQLQPNEARVEPEDRQAVQTDEAGQAQPVDVFMNALEERAQERQQAQADLEHRAEPREGSSQDFEERPRPRRADTGRSPSPFDLAAASTFGANMMDILDQGQRDDFANLSDGDIQSDDRPQSARHLDAEDSAESLARAREAIGPSLFFPAPQPPQPAPPANADPALRQLPVVPPPPLGDVIPALGGEEEPVAEAQPQPHAAANEQDDERDLGAEDLLDDLDGILEAVGMKGSLLTFVQNVGLMILLVSICLTGGVWAPLCVGRVLSAINAFKLIVSPIRLVRLVSDPIFDAALRTVSNIFRSIVAPVRHAIVDICRSAPLFMGSACARMLSGPANLASGNSDVTTNAADASVYARRSAALKRAFETVSDHWQRMPYETDKLHRGLCVALGYAAILFGGVCYVRSTHGEYSEQMHRAIRENIRQQFVLLKVCAFVLIEIIAFPAMCGALLDLATLPLFPEATISSRLAFHARTPLTAFFVVWFSGTGFMFIFASWIDHVRTFVRPGLIWFVRDPQSSEFHPVREILTKSAREQARKLATSALMYAGVVFASVGTCVYGVHLILPGVLPLHLPLIRLHSVPFDLVFYRYVVPYSLRFLDPRASVQNMYQSWAKKTAHQLRLSSFLFGQRDASEEGSHVRRTWRALLTLKRGDTNNPETCSTNPGNSVSRADVVFSKDGGFGRVPAVDNIRVAPGRRMIVRVDEQGKPLDHDGARIVVAQLIEMSTNRKSDKYQIVYLPPNFTWRVCLFLYLMWFTGSLAACGAFVVPLVAGRWLFSFVSSQPTHDLYALGLGLYVVGSGVLLARCRPQRIFSSQGVRRLVHGTVLALVVGVALPILVSLAGFAFVYVPYTLFKGMSLGDDKGQVSISVLHCWTTGTVLLQLLVKMSLRFNVLPQDDALRIRIEAAARAWSENKLIETATLVNGPATLVCLVSTAALATPVLAAVFWSRHVAHADATPLGVFQVACTLCALLAAVAASHNKVQSLVSEWSRRKLEETYLVTKQLQNWNRVKAG
ncbi:hypothetical protein ACM66B_002040 [Microbotryomycetes sp. NB124-2]